MYPIAMLVGQAGAGKDAVADILVEELGGTKISLATPLKEFAKEYFGFSHDQLYGPSHLRNEVDPRWEDLKFRNKVFDRILDSGAGGGVDVFNRFFEDSYVHRRSDRMMTRLEKWLHQLESVPLTPRLVLQTLGTEVGRSIDPDVWIKVALSEARTKLRSGANLVVIPDGRFKNEALHILDNNGKLIKIVNPEGPTIQSSHTSETESQTIPSFWYDKVFANKKKGLDLLRLSVLQWSL